MSPNSLLADSVNVRKMHSDYIIILERNASSDLSTESAEFEFDSGSSSELNGEPPLSPKLLYSANYSPNVAISALMALSNQFSDIHASKADYVKQLHQRPFNHERHAANAAEEIKQRTNLNSNLLNRRDLEQLSPLTNHQINYKDIVKRQVRRPVNRSSPASTTSSSSSTSPSSSPINYRDNHCADPCKFEDDHPESKICQKKGRSKWAFKLDFLRKGPSCRGADPAINQMAAGDARFNQQIDQSSTSHHRAAAVAARVEANLNNRINQRIDINYRVAAAPAEITEFESPRQSTCSVSSSVSRSTGHADNEMIRDDDHRKISRSAPISPAGTPPRSPHGAGEGAFTQLTRGRRAPMSPHALYYQQQRARNEELRRKTFLPYRISACFFASPPKAHAHAHAPQAVY